MQEKKIMRAMNLLGERCMALLRVEILEAHCLVRLTSSTIMFVAEIAS